MHDTLAAWLAWGATVVGAGLLARGVLGDLRGGRRSRRCPRCWYDMWASPGLTCPECGRAARHERALHRRRRSGKLAIVGVILLVGSHPLHAVPDVKERGWSGAVPTTALIVALAWLRPDLEQIATSHGRYLYAPRDVETVPERLYLDLLDARVVRNRLWGWQERLLSAVCRGLVADPDPSALRWETTADEMMGSTRWAGGRTLDWSSLEPASRPVTATTRPRWPVGVPIHARIGGHANSFQYRIVGRPETRGLREFTCDRMPGVIPARTVRPTPWIDGLVPLGTPENATDDLRYTILLEDAEFANPLFVHRWRRIDRQDLRLDTEIVGAVSDYVQPVPSDAVAAALEQILDPLLTGAPVTLHLGATERALAQAMAPIHGSTLALRAEVLDGDRVVATGAAWYRSRLASSPWIEPYGTSLDLEVLDAAALDPARDLPLTLRLCGDSVVALRDFGCRTYWDGEIVVPVPVVADGSPWIPRPSR